MARFFTLDTGFQDDDRIGSVLRIYGNAGLGALVLTWAHVAAKGALPGTGVNSDGKPFDLANVAKRARVSLPYFRKLMDSCAKSGHIDRDQWEAKGLLVFPAMAKRMKAYHDAKSSTERTQAHRDRVFGRVADRSGNICVHCSSPDDLELERRIPRELGGSNAEDNLQIACLPCARKRRAERRAKAEQDETQDVTGENTGPIRSDLVRSDPVSTNGDRSTDSTHTLRARDENAGPATQSPLPIVGAVPPAKVSPFPPRLNPAFDPESAPLTHGHASPRGALKCLAPCGRVCYPLPLAEEHARAVGGDPDQALDYVRRFRDRVLATLPETPVGDKPFDFWRAHWAHAHPSAAPKHAPGDPSRPNAAAGRTGAADAANYDRMTRRDGDAPRRQTGG